MSEALFRMPSSTHATLRRAIVLEKFRLAFIPIPKTGCTSILWALTELAGLSEHDFRHSSLPEVTPALTVHDLSIWGPERTNLERGETFLQEMGASESWLTFAVVRNPARRLWSAWQSKILLREPRFVKRFGTRPWFPQIPQNADDIIESFNAFVAALTDNNARVWDPHWAPQSDLLGACTGALHHLGRTEQLNATLSVVEEHLAKQDHQLPKVGQENPSLLPFNWNLFHEQTLSIVDDIYKHDASMFGYSIPAEAPQGDTRAWKEQVESQLGAVREIIARNTRIADFYALLDSKIAQRQRLSSQVEEYEPTLQRAINDAKRAAKAHTQSQQRVHRLEAQVRELKAQVHELEERVVTGDRERQRAQRYIKELEREMERKGRTIRAMLGSTSWRVTKPLRLAGRIIKRTSKRGLGQYR